jgi:hypothetical protein
MDIVISQENLDFIVSQLKNDDRDCSWQLAFLPRTGEDTVIHQYWKDKQSKIRKALRELGVARNEV